MNRTRERLRVLGVEDDPIQARLYEAYLNAAGIEFLLCSDPEDFLESVVAWHPHLVLMDVDLPGVRGYDLVRRLRETGTDDLLPVIFATSYTDDQTRLETGRVAAEGYLVKPIPAPVLVDSVKAQIERWNDLRSRVDHDSLTGVLTHAAFLRRVDEAVRRQSGVLVLFDLDHFKDYNDRNGHVAGDERLRDFALILAAHWSDAAIGRLGGDEFAIVTDAPADVIRQWLDLFHVRCAIPFTAGVAEWQAGMDVRRWREAVDASLYASKPIARIA